MLDLRPLRHFINIVDLGSLSRAAEFAGIAQPALSHQVAALEAELGVRLLHRTPQGTTPTEAGRTLYRYARALLRQLDETRRAVRDADGTLSGQVSIGLSVTTAEILCVPLLAALRQAHPAVRPEITALPNRLVRELLVNGRLDIALLFDQPTVKGITAERLAAEEQYFIVAPAAARAAAMTPVPFAELGRHDLILPCRPHGIRVALETILLREGIGYTVAVEIDSPPSLLEAVGSGLGASVMPWAAVHRHAASGRLSVHPFEGGLSREVMLCSSDAAPPSDAADACRRLIQDVIRELVAGGAWRGLRLL